MKKSKKMFTVITICIMVLMSSRPVLATTYDIMVSTSQASSYLNYDRSAYLEIMFLSSQVHKDLATKTYNPQEFKRANADNVHGTIYAKASYLIKNCTCRYYANQTFLGSRYDTAK